MSIERHIVQRARGHRHGPITRLISPNGLGQLLKPFVFLDYVDAPAEAGPDSGFHPHSGIATLTFPLTFREKHETSEGRIADVEQGGVEWVVAGGGVWHRSNALTGGGRTELRGFQLWIALPPSLERAKPSAYFARADELPHVGPVKVLAGIYAGVSSPIPVTGSVNCFWVELEDGNSWTYRPSPGHRIAWAFAQSGTLVVDDQELTREMAVFEDDMTAETPIEFRAKGHCGFLVGSAVKHNYDLVLGNYSVHIDSAARAAGEKRIVEIREELRGQRRL